MIIIYILLVALVLFVFVTFVVWAKRHVARGSDEYELDHFVRYFRDRGFKEPLVISVYQYLQKWMNRADFSVKPTDNIAGVYGIVDEDLDDFVVQIAEVNHLELPENADYWHTPVATVEDLVRFVSTFSLKKASR
jgi:hypothetical protein